MTPFELLAAIWLVSALAMALVWALSMRLNNVGYVDVAWAALMAVAAVMAGVFGSGAVLPRLLVATMGSIWGLRLSLHLLVRVRHEPEDGRYQSLRATWGGSAAKFFVFFQMQALVVALFSLPFIAAASRRGDRLDGYAIAAVAIWVLAVAGESLADRQLARFRADPGNRGKTCRVGLWSW
jgi:steroid 5-alpha reductase family enzyme